MHVYPTLHSVACTKYDTIVELKDYKQRKAENKIFLRYEILTPTPAKVAFLHYMEEIVKTFNSYRFRIHWAFAIIMKYHHQNL